VIFTPTRLPGAYLVDIEARCDERGFFARAWCAREFEQHGLSARFVNANISHNLRKGTLRGMHYQRAPYAESKVVRCTRGSVFDVIIDLRPHSSTLGEWIGVELTAANHRMLVVPEGFAHGFVTLVDDTEVTYQVSEYFTPEAEGGVRWDDPAFAIDWPVEVRVVSDKDRSWPLVDTPGIDARAGGSPGVQ
jgi:dTDP-4-dehydrorhamnose 3,5-epimerase